MKTIKIIDLLNKIANDDKYRPNIKFRKITYTYKEEFNDYKNDNNSNWGILNGFCINMILNDEVEIIEEDKKIKKLNKDRYAGTDLDISGDMFEKINELIDIVNELKEDK